MCLFEDVCRCSWVFSNSPKLETRQNVPEKNEKKKNPNITQPQDNMLPISKRLARLTDPVLTSAVHTQTVTNREDKHGLSIILTTIP